MCLYIYLKKYHVIPPAKIADEDIICYKELIQFNNELYSPCFAFEYELNKTYKLDEELTVDLCVDPEMGIIEKGFHTYKDIGHFIVGTKHKNVWFPITEKSRSFKKCCVTTYKCIIPKGSSYYLSFDGSEIVSNQIKILPLCV